MVTSDSMPPRIVEPRGVDDPSRRDIDIVAGQRCSSSRAPRPCTRKCANEVWSNSSQPSRVAACSSALRSNHKSATETVWLLRAPPRLPQTSWRAPSRRPRQNSTLRSETIMQRGAAHAARRGGAAMRPVQAVEQTNGLGGAIVQVPGIALKRHRRAGYRFPSSRRRAPRAHPVRHHAARATSGFDAARVESGGDVTGWPLPARGPSEIAVVRREALRAIEEKLHAGALAGGDALRGSFPGSARDDLRHPAADRMRNPRVCLPCPRACRGARTRRPAACRRLPSRRNSRRDRAPSETSRAGHRWLR